MYVLVKNQFTNGLLSSPGFVLQYDVASVITMTELISNRYVNRWHGVTSSKYNDCVSLIAVSLAVVYISRTVSVRHIQTLTHAHTHARTHARTYARMHARTHARTHAHTHIRTCTRILSISLSLSLPLSPSLSFALSLSLSLSLSHSEILLAQINNCQYSV